MKLLLLTLPLLFVASLSAKELIYDETTKLLWQDNDDSKSKKVNFEEAEEFCKNVKIGSYEDFRLPTLSELHSLVDYNKYKPAIMDGFKGVSNEVYLTQTLFTNDSGSVWAINFKNGKTDIIAKNYTRRVRCVKNIK